MDNERVSLCISYIVQLLCSFIILYAISCSYYLKKSLQVLNRVLVNLIGNLNVEDPLRIESELDELISHINFAHEYLSA